MNLPLAVEIWFFKDIQLWLPVWTGSKDQIRVTFLSIFFYKQRSVQWCKNCEFTSCGCWDMIFLNIKLWFIVIRYLMTSSWRHKFCIIYLLCSKYMPSFKKNTGKLWPSGTTGSKGHTILTSTFSNVAQVLVYQMPKYEHHSCTIQWDSVHRKM